MSRHHWMYFGCQCSSARCSRLLLERLTLFGIFSAEIMTPRCQALVSFVTFASSVSALGFSGALPIELRPALLAVHFQRTFFADRVRPLKDPVLPGREPSKDFRFHRLGPGEAQ